LAWPRPVAAAQIFWALAVQQQRRRWHTQKACLVEVQQSDSDDVKHKSAHAYMMIISKRKNRQN
jgi:hypothetical protein